MNALETIQPLDANADQPPRDVLDAALMYLMTRYTLRRCPGIAKGIVHHLELLLSHPDLGSSPVERSAYEGLLADWRLIAFDNSCAIFQNASPARGSH